MEEIVNIEYFRNFIPNYILENSVIRTSYKTMFFPYLKINLNGKLGKVKNRDVGRYHLSKITSIYEKPLVYVILDKEHKMSSTLKYIGKYAEYLNSLNKNEDELLSIFRINFRFLKI